MGQKVNPKVFRIGLAENNTWDSKWYSQREYATNLHEDLKIRDLIKKELSQAAISKIEIERLVKKVVITIHTAKPGVVIGKKGSDIDLIKKKIQNLTNCEIHLNIVEIRKPEIDALLIAQNIATQLEKRISFRRAMKRVMQAAMKMGAKGIRVNCSGRLGGAEIARMEWYRQGRVPLHTLRADIDYGIARANTTYGVIGVKVWVYKGQFEEKDKLEVKNI